MITARAGEDQDWKFFGCTDAIRNLRILRIRMKSDKILPNQYLGYHGKNQISAESD